MPLYTDGHLPDNELHRLLLKAVPENAHGNKTISHLAGLIPCRRWSVNKWIRANKLTPSKATRIVEIAGIGVPDGQPPRVTIEELHPFVYKT